MAAARDLLSLLVIFSLFFCPDCLSGNLPDSAKINSDISTNKSRINSVQIYEKSQRAITTKHKYGNPILNCGDVKPHPGPGDAPIKAFPADGSTKWTRCSRFPCLSCGKGVTKASKAVACHLCGLRIHTRCALISDERYRRINDGKEDSECSCDACRFRHLPFCDETIGPEGVDALWARPQCNGGTVSFDENYGNNFAAFRRKGLHFIHLNIRSLIPKLAEVRWLVR